MGESRHRRGRRGGRHVRRRLSLVEEIRFLFRGTNRRYTITALLSVVAAMALLSVAVVTVRAIGPRIVHAGADGRPEQAASRGAGPAPNAARPEQRVAPGDDALAFLRRADPSAARHAKDVRWSGEYLRVYTDLPEYDDNSRTAVELCQAASSYLARQLGKAEPIVFVHAEESGNGHVVLANKLDAGDGCEVGATR